MALGQPAQKQRNMQKINVLIGWDQNYSASCDDAPGCIATAHSLEGIKREFAAALEFHLEGMREDGYEIPAVFDGEYELEFELNGRVQRRQIQENLEHIQRNYLLSQQFLKVLLQSPITQS